MQGGEAIGVVILFGQNMIGFLELYSKSLLQICFGRELAYS